MQTLPKVARTCGVLLARDDASREKVLEMVSAIRNSGGSEDAKARAEGQPTAV